MGCLQSNLTPSSSTQPHPKKFIDHIKQSSIDSNQRSHLINHQGQLSKIPQSSSQQSYQYSKHDLQQQEQYKDSQVSIFQQQRKKLQQRSKKRLHVEIHPDVIERQNRREIEQLLRESERIYGNKSKNVNNNKSNRSNKSNKSKSNRSIQSISDNNNKSKDDISNKSVNMKKKKGTIFPIGQQLMLSNIKMNNNNNVQQNQQNILINNNNNHDKLQQQQQDDNNQPNEQQQLMSMLEVSKKQFNNGLLFSKQKILDINSNSNQNIVNIDKKQNNRQGDSQTDRQLLELHGELTTMIIQWEKLANGTKRLKVEQMNTTQRNNNKKQQQHQQQQQLIYSVKKQQQQQQLLQNRQKDNKNNNNNNEVDKQLQQIWNQQQQKQQKQLNQQQQLLNSITNHLPITTHEQSLNQQKKSKQKEQSPNIQNPTQNNNTLSHINNKSLQDLLQLNKQPQQSSSSQQQQQQQYSKCLLSNPTKILNDSLVDQCNQEKHIFYYGHFNQSNKYNHQQKQQRLKYYQKWIETDRKAYQVKDQDILSLLHTNNKNNSKQHKKQNHNKHQHKQQQQQQQQILTYKQSNTILFPLLCVIKGYRQLNRVNLIAFRTMTSTSILLSQKDHSNNYIKQSGFRIFYNGVKRLYPFEEGFDGSDLFRQLVRMFGRFYNNGNKNSINNNSINNEKEQTYQKSASQLLYNLTGWVPETIMVNEISSYQGVFQRLNSNYIDGNTIITFTSRDNTNNTIYGLKSIDQQNKQIHLFTCKNNNNHPNEQLQQKHNNKQSTPQSSIIQHQHQQTYKWQLFITMISEINVNWNTSIYDYVWKSQNVFYLLNQLQLSNKDTIEQYDNEYIQHISHQYLLRIPPSQDDIQVRVFMQIHYKDQCQSQQQSKQQSLIQDNLLVIQLHDYTGSRVNSSAQAIRKIEKKNKLVFSDVLIFQSSKQKTQYLLVIRPIILPNNKIISQTSNNIKLPSIKISNQNTTIHPPIKYTISALTFTQVSLQQLPSTRAIQQKLITTYLQQSHCSYGINSPHFLNNFYLQLKVPPLQKIKIYVEMPIKQCKFQINLIANPDGEENLTRLNLENILGDIVTSQQFQNGKGYLQIQSKYEQYFLMITNHTPCKGQFKIIIQVLQNVPKYLTLQKLLQIQSNILINSNNNKQQQQQQLKLISTKQKYFYQQPIFNKQFTWLPTHTGPRKRLKSNTHNGYQPFLQFKQFFKNPFIDYKVDKYKQLQFSIYSKSYQQYFDSLTTEQDDDQLKSQLQPPTISLAILKIKRPNQIISSSHKNISNESLFKIILDDAFYVPFGFGFWSKVMEIQAGEYRFVFPKMQKESGVGVFNIYQIDK